MIFKNCMNYVLVYKYLVNANDISLMKDLKKCQDI